MRGWAVEQDGERWVLIHEATGERHPLAALDRETAEAEGSMMVYLLTEEASR